MDEQDHAVLGGNAESIGEALTQQFQPGMHLAAAVKLGAQVLAPDGAPLGADQLEVALLDRARDRRAFRRIRNGELESLLA
jgi:proteasome alpha subunit